MFLKSLSGLCNISVVLSPVAKFLNPKFTALKSVSSYYYAAWTPFLKIALDVAAAKLITLKFFAAAFVLCKKFRMSPYRYTVLGV